MTHSITFMWTVPRSVSTSFERMMSARGDHAVFDEPFSRRYYFGPDRRSERFDEQLEHSAPEEIVDMIEAAAREQPVFVKDMAYHATGLLEPDLLRRFRNSFLVRDPAATLRSLARHWPDFTEEEAGWHALEQAADVVESIGQPLVVLDAAQLCADPRGVVGAWCEAMGMPFVEEALSWEPGMRDEWELWEEWHASTARSTGFDELADPPPAPSESEPRMAELYRKALPVYERMLAHVVRVEETVGTVGAMTDSPDAGRVERRADLLPEEIAAGSDAPREQAKAVLEDSDDRTEHPEETRHESTQTPDE